MHDRFPAMPSSLRRRAGRLATLLALAVAGMAVQAEPLVWLKQNLPPATITEGPNEGQGYVDQLVDYALGKLRRHKVTIEKVPLVRELEMMKQGGAYCTRDFLATPEREAFLRFTAPVGRILPVVLIVRTADRARYDRLRDADGLIGLDTLGKQAGLVFGVTAKRTYGARADAVLKRIAAESAGRIAPVYGQNVSSTLFRMLQAERVDAFLAYPTEAMYISRDESAYYTYPIAESRDLVTLSFSCTRDARTDAAFADLDALARTTELQKTFQAAYERWLPPYLVPVYRSRLAAK